MKYKALIFAAIYVALIVLSIGITFMWRYAIGVWALICLLGNVFKNSGSKS